MLQTTSGIQTHSPFFGPADDEHTRKYWNETCETYRSHLASYANRLTNHRSHDAEDLVHDTYCRAFAHLRSPDSIKNPRAYLFRMMRNVWIDRWKRENRANFESLELQKTRQLVSQRYVVAPTVLQSLEREDRRREFVLRRGRLNQRETRLLEMLFAGQTVADIAGELREDVRVVRTDVNAVRNKIRYRVKLCNSKTVS